MNKILDAHELKKFNKISKLKALTGLLRVWIPVALCLWFFLKFPWILPILWVVIASRQHALAGLAHDAAHGILFESKLFNDWTARVFCSFPILVSLSRYRAIHLLHHRKLYSAEDPDLPIYDRYPVSRQRWRKYLWRDSAAQTAFKNLYYFVPLPKCFYPKGVDPIKHYPYQSDGLALFAYLILAHIVLYWHGLLLAWILLWWVPYFTFLQVLLRVRGALEHGAIPLRKINTANEYLNTRTVVDSPLILSILAPLGLNYHLEHHLYPTIPWYHLDKVHKKLMLKGPKDKLVSSTYAKAVSELLDCDSSVLT